MALTLEQRRDTARELARRLYVETNQTATLNLDDLLVAIASIDTTMDALPSALTAGQSVRANLVARLPEPFKSGTTAQQKALALMLWAMKETGLL